MSRLAAFGSEAVVRNKPRKISVGARRWLCRERSGLASISKARKDNVTQENGSLLSSQIHLMRMKSEIVQKKGGGWRAERLYVIDTKVKL